MRKKVKEAFLKGMQAKRVAKGEVRAPLKSQDHAFRDDVILKSVEEVEAHTSKRRKRSRSRGDRKKEKTMDTKKETAKKEHDDNMHSRSRGKYKRSEADRTHASPARKCIRLKSRSRPGGGPYATLPRVGLIGVDRGLKERSQSFGDMSDPIPAPFEFGYIMVATWAIGASCEVGAFAKHISSNPFDVVVFAMMPAVADDNPVLKFLNGLSAYAFES